MWRKSEWLFVLGDDADAAMPEIDAVRQGEVDDAELAAEVHGRFGARVGQLFEAEPGPSQDQGDGSASEPMGHGDTGGGAKESSFVICRNH